MANIMSQVDFRNKPSRNGFDLSMKRNFTAKVGEILPVWYKSIIPGDKFRIDLKSFTRTQPLNTAAYGRIREYFDLYFVPMESLWNKFPEVIQQLNDNPVHNAVGVSPSSARYSGQLPFFTCASLATYINTMAKGIPAGGVNYNGYRRAPLTCKLLSYLGYPDFSAFLEEGNTWASNPFNVNLQLSPFPLLAYQRIYNDFFRFTQWENSQPSCFNIDFMKGLAGGVFNPWDIALLGSNTSDFFKYYNMFDLRYCNYNKDLLFGLLPQQQLGDTSVALLSGIIQAGDVTGAVSGNSINFSKAPVAGNNTGVAISMGITDKSSAGIDILALRQAEFLQKWKEVAQSAGKTYREQVKAHWGVDVPVTSTHEPIYLGGTASSLNVGEVINNNITGDNAADIAGKGTFVQNGVIEFETKGEYGILMCIYHAVPQIDYIASNVDMDLTKVKATDWAIPEFDKIGMQSVPLSAFVLDNKDKFTSTNSAPLDNIPIGYAPRYIEYKTSLDRSMGAFASSLQSWIIGQNSRQLLSRIYGNDSPTGIYGSSVNYSLFKVSPADVDSIFAVEADDTVDTDQLLVESYFDIKAVRNLDVNGLPY